MAIQTKNPPGVTGQGAPSLPIEPGPTLPVEGEGPAAGAASAAEAAGAEVSRNPFGSGLKPGALHYRAYVGPPGRYDLIAAMSFSLLATLGMRGHHRVLDIGCGSLRLGRLLIPYLDRGNYVGLEPNRWLIDEAFRHELGRDIMGIKDPQFHCNGEFEVPVESGPFHFAVAQSVFSHAALGQVHKCLAMVQRRLTRTGALAATFVAGEEDYEGTEWVYPGVVSYRPITMMQLARQYEFQFQLLDWKHPNGQQWCLFARPGFDTRWFQDQPVSWNGLMQSMGF